MLLCVCAYIYIYFFLCVCVHVCLQPATTVNYFTVGAKAIWETKKTKEDDPENMEHS